MRRTVVPILLALACAASHAGCTRAGPSPGGIGSGGGGSPGAESGEDSVVAALKDFTEELASRVESAADTKAGVAEAQGLLDSRGGQMAARIDALRKSPRMSDPAARGRWLEAEVDGINRVRGLQTKYFDASLRDPELKAGLERLAAGYDLMFKER